MPRNSKKPKVEIFRFVPPAPAAAERPREYVESQVHVPASPVKKGSASAAPDLSVVQDDEADWGLGDIFEAVGDIQPGDDDLPDLLSDDENDSGEEDADADQAGKKPYEFIKALERRTDNTGTVPVPDRYKAWLRMVREWRHVRLLKRMGRGHDPSGVAGTSPGELAVLCPACPYPDINLPGDYDQLPAGDQWKYTLFLGMDANFRLRRVKVSSEERDPGLNKGYAYIVDEGPFKEYLSTYNTQIEDDKSDCRNHDAIKSASIRGGKGQAASGMGTVQCARHDMKRPLGNGDLQKGERYVNMDYFFLSTLLFKIPRSVAISYDIACQWSKNLEERCELYPPNAVSSNADLELRFFVPKFHLPAHIVDCQLGYSLNYLPRVGRTDGEAPERAWSLFNGLAYSTREMGPGSRRDTLDDNFGDHNWVKITRMASSFKEKATDAVAARRTLTDAFLAFSKAIPLDIVGRWTGEVQAWEREPTLKTSPFRQEGDGKSEAEVRRELAEEDKKALEKGEDIHLHNVSPAQLIGKGIEIEDQQRRLGADKNSLGPHSTELQKARILERENSLKRKIESWIQIQHVYIPALALLRKREEEEGTGSEATPVPEIDLLLPSAAMPRVDIPSQFRGLEFRYRKAQGFSTLRDLRSQLLLKSHMLHSKKTHVLGVRQATRSSALIQNLERRIASTAEKYRYVHSCLTVLSPKANADWCQELRPLKPEDIKVLTLDQDGGEGHKALTWIWKLRGTVMMKDDPEVQAALRVEWCKTRARAHRWQEECLLLAEEMRRVKAFFRWEISTWEARVKDVATRFERPVLEGTPLAITDMVRRSKEAFDLGRVAYAARTGDMWSRMLNEVSSAWKGLEGVLVGETGFVEDSRL
ncbi:hypothetical protein MD484_g7802, partial [Candolleomyces efflorescens]